MSTTNMSIILEEESGKVVKKLEMDELVIGMIRSEANKMNLKCLSFIDLYGDTIFNTLQMNEITKECLILKSELKKKTILINLDKLSNLSQEGSKIIHSRIKIIGN